ncbi:TonB-dependent receptor plug domain-containing protein [Psychroserpens sp.]|uniref:TonB-dependent receptor plug domain-containing protein n=1 Tax=Psychroserpens sp. TaxID=2020870 RepID=UPI003859461C
MRQFISLVFLLIITYVNAQNVQSYNYDKISLNEVIKDIEKQHDVNFSYAIDLIKEKQITINIENIEFEELLNILESQTSLTFEQISKNQIIIAPKNTDDKICGYVLDFDSKLPLPYAVISSSTGENISTDFKGFFLIENTEDNTFSISNLGYVTQEFTGKKTCQQIYLNVDNEVLDEVIISGYVTSGIDRNKDGSIDVTSKSLGILPGLVTPDLLQSIQLIPGINSLDESASGIQIRGGSPDQNLILFDDIKLFNTGHFYGMFSTLNPYATQKASIFKSGTSAVYGDRISGIIDITSGEDIPNKPESGFGIDGLSIDAYIKTPLSNKLAVYAFIRRSTSDIYRSSTYESYSDKIFTNTGTVRNSNGDIINVTSDDEYTEDSSSDSFSFHDINTKIIFAPNTNNKFIFSGLTTRNAIDFSFTDDGETKVDDLITENNGLSLKWDHKSSKTNSEIISLYFSKYDSNYSNRALIGGVLDERNTRNNFITDIGLNAKFIRLIGERQYLTFGYQISNSNVEIVIAQEEQVDTEDNINIDNTDYNLKNALFAEYEYNTNNSSVIGIGLRAVHYSSLKNGYLEPRINAEYKIGENLRIKGSLERRHQPISQIIEFDQGELRLENSTWRLSNDTDSPLLRSDQISTGLLYDNDGWTIDFDAYYKELTGLTSLTNGFGNPQMKLDEGESIIRGVDVLIRKRIDNYRIWAGYTYNNIRFDFPDIQVGDFPGNNDITHSFRISNSLHVNDFEFSLGWQYRTGEPYTPIENFDEGTSLVSYGSINSVRLKDYHRMDASAIYNFKIHKVKDWKAQLGISVLNIYNRKIPISYTYISEDEGAGLELQQVIQRFSLGITPNASFRLFF